MAVGSTLAYVTPHLNGAIDIMAVRQPDGTIKTSPFYGEKRGCGGIHGRTVAHIVLEGCKYACELTCYA